MTSQPPSPHDTSELLALAERISTIAGRQFTIEGDDATDVWTTARKLVDLLTPPPAEPEPWTLISTDWHAPTLATITFEYPDGKGHEVTSLWWREGDQLHLAHEGETTFWFGKSATSVTPLAVCPADHVPVPWKLLHRAVWWVANGFIDDAIEASDTEAREIVRDLAALVEKGAES